MRSILLHIHEDDCLEARFQVALDLARAFSGHLSCIQAVPYEFGVPGDIYGTMAVQPMPDIRRAADTLQNRLKQRLAEEDVAWDFRQEDGFAPERLLRRCGLSDVVIVGSCDPLRSNGPAPLAGDLVLKAHTPVLIVPPESRGLDCSGSAFVAWDGSPEAARALRSAVPLLRKAASVTLATVPVGKDGKNFDLPQTQGAEYLSRHGIGCEIVELSCEGSVAQTLARAASSRKATYLVMGAYGRPRLLETVWGGVTRELFTNPPFPILAGH